MDTNGIRTPQFPSFRRISLVTCATIFAAETATMLTLCGLGLGTCQWANALLNTLLVINLMIPALYYFLYRPVFWNMREYVRLEEQLIKSRSMVDLMVRERTNMLVREIEECSSELAKAREELRAAPPGHENTEELPGKDAP